MAFVKFPHRVKVNGEYYAPGTLIEVDDAAEYVKQGATEETKKGGKRTAKPSTSPKVSTRKNQ